MSTPFSITDPVPTVYTYKALAGSYTGYAYEDTATAVKLLGKDPALADKNEVVQSSGKGSRSCSIEVFADTVAVRDQFVALLFKKCIHNDGIEADRNVIVMSAKPRMWLWSGGVPIWLVAIEMRETV